MTPVVAAALGCPSVEDYDIATGVGGDELSHVSVDVPLLSGYVAAALPDGGCGYAEVEASQSDSSENMSRRVNVAYFNLGENGQPTFDDLRDWAGTVGASDLGEDVDAGGPLQPDGTFFNLPSDFSGWTPGWLEQTERGDATYQQSAIPEYTDRPGAVVSFLLGESDVDAVELASTGDEDADYDPVTAMASGLDATFAGSFDVTDLDGYTLDIEVSGSLSPFTSELANSKPGQFEALGYASASSFATNTTEGRDAPIPEFSLVAIYDINSDFCGGDGYLSRAGDSWQDPSFCQVGIGIHRPGTVSAGSQTDEEIGAGDLTIGGLDENSNALAEMNAPLSIYATFGSEGGISTNTTLTSSSGCQTSAGSGAVWYVPMDGWPDPVCS
ncbi:hypothetical protein JK386_02440 [Nocardioides sp. zg-536]|uniref:Uncharacterized protein n=1 Tax=Nocardioides faecalis TaxID=2803858 RepID=A0A938XYD9_9ACTN|nr:hypothetical protein [Nocardioides faecalis]MBM9458747.1 hypothetical protein [Nocardioides faecalis]QVI60166.1 hypothetical protein KG111_07700 [Nocardioides faecalis]